MSICRGLKVIDCGSFVAGPAAGTLLGDFGADVIKIEPPGDGDRLRHISALPSLPQSDLAYCWLLDSRNKRGLALDLARPEGQAVLHRLVETADVFITNVPLPIRRKLGLDHDRLARLNDRLIYASLTAYGETGDESNRKGFDATAYWARSGMLETMRSDGGAPPGRTPVGGGDHPAAVSLFAAITLALYERERTGRGGRVGTSLLANGVWANGHMAQAVLCGAEFAPFQPRESQKNALAMTYRCRDRRWLMLAISNHDRDWPLLAKCLGIEDAMADPRFRTSDDRFAHAAELIALLDSRFATRDCAEWRALFERLGLAFEAVSFVTDLTDDRQMYDAGVFVPIENEELWTIDSPMFVAGAAKSKPRMAPGLGEHTDEILREAGYDEAAIAKLRAHDVVA